MSLINDFLLLLPRLKNHPVIDPENNIILLIQKLIKITLLLQSWAKQELNFKNTHPRLVLEKKAEVQGLQNLEKKQSGTAETGQ